jgi:demethylmenaquinone methyltransferase/2-methoxy-6-polyprenyl-1,4-benzoquinol methylase
MFGRIAPRYDLLNRMLSFGQDRRWRRLAVRLLDLRPGSVLLDAAAGTADVALTAAKFFPEAGKIIAVDFSEPMLRLGLRKIAKAGHKVPVVPVAADAALLPLPDACVDAVTIAFGIRNVVDVPAALSEFHRVLKPGGRLLILEFARPRGRFFGSLFRWYFTRVLPRVGGLISGSRAAYEYLPRSVDDFFEPDSLKMLMRGAGFSILGVESYSLGVVLAYLGAKADG